MRIRTVIAATVLAAFTVLGGAGVAAAEEPKPEDLIKQPLSIPTSMLNAVGGLVPAAG